MLPDQTGKGSSFNIGLTLLCQQTLLKHHFHCEYGCCDSQLL